ncbi:MAG: CAP domain-containing protein [Clostridia bacterium]|nr:CAP domain-containing protein [Clostridia bacterium]
MTSSVKIFVSFFLILACTVTVLSGCNSKAPSLLITKEETTKEKFDPDSFDEEYYRTSVSSEETSASAETETEADVSETRPAEETGTTSATEAQSTTLREAVTEITELITYVSATSVTSTAKDGKSGLFGKGKTTTTAKTVVDTRVDVQEKKTEIQYGVIRIDVTSTYYDIYEDGTEKQTSQKNYSKYDGSKFKATTAQLLDEAKANKSKYSAEINSAFNSVNSIRKEAGVSELSLDDSLCNAACVRATEIAYSGNTSHKRPDKTSCETVLTDLGITWKHRSEFIAQGYSEGAQAASAWKAEGDYYKDMVSPKFTKVGVGVAAAPDGRLYWCMIFTGEGTEE